MGDVTALIISHGNANILSFYYPIKPRELFSKSKVEKHY